MNAPTYEKLTPPTQGTRVTVDAAGKWIFPDDPIVCLLKGDGIGEDVGGIPGITTCAVRVLDAAVQKAYASKKKIVWFDVHAGDVARHMYNPGVADADIGKLSEDEQRQLYLPDDTLKAFEYYRIGLKGPLTTPIGGGFRSINVYLRFRFDLYGCVRPVKYYRGIDAPNRNANRVDMVIFRENTEDVYCGVEFKSGSDRAKKVIALLREMGYGPERAARQRPASASSRSAPERSKPSQSAWRCRYALDKKLPQRDPRATRGTS